MRSRRYQPPRGLRYAVVRGAWAAEREAERRRLLCQIEMAFDGVRLGNGVSLHQARAIDNYEPDDAVAAARTFDTELDWREIQDEKIDRLGDALPFLDAEGFRFYIPRFMVYALNHLESSTSFASASAVDSADPPAPAPAFALLSDDQRQAVRDFASFFRTQQEA